MPVEEGSGGGREGRKGDREGVNGGEVQKSLCAHICEQWHLLPTHGLESFLSWPQGLGSLLLELGPNLAHLLFLPFCLCKLKLSTV